MTPKKPIQITLYIILVVLVLMAVVATIFCFKNKPEPIEIPNNNQGENVSKPTIEERWSPDGKLVARKTGSGIEIYNPGTKEVVTKESSDPNIDIKGGKWADSDSYFVEVNGETKSISYSSEVATGYPYLSKNSYQFSFDGQYVLYQAYDVQEKIFRTYIYDWKKDQRLCRINAGLYSFDGKDIRVERWPIKDGKTLLVESAGHRSSVRFVYRLDLSTCERYLVLTEDLNKNPNDTGFTFDQLIEKRDGIEKVGLDYKREQEFSE